MAALACALVFAHGVDALASPTRVDRLISTALELDPDSSNGAAVYAEHCARCHGATAAGNPASVIPALAGQRESYLVKQLADFTELEREGRQMHEVVAKAALSEPQVWADLAKHLSDLPPAQKPETGDGGGVNLGEAVFREQCASCHQEDARGDDDGFVPSLRNQHYSYLLQQMRSLASWRRHNADADLVRFLDSLEVEDLTAVADYLSRQQGPARDRSRLRNNGNLRN